MPLLKKRRTLAAKQETTPGTAVSLTSGTDGIINAYDVAIDADIPFNERVAEGAFGRQVSNVGAYAGSVKFKVEAVGSGTAGTAPAWATVLLPSCGMAASSGLFTPISAFSAQKSLTIAVYEDGAHKYLTGAMGSYTISGEDGKIAVFEFDFKGVWNAPTDVAMFTPQFSAVIPPRFAGATLTVGSYTPTASKLSIKYGTKVEMREDVTQASGYISAVITDRVVTGTLDPEQTLVATYDAYGAWLGGTVAALSCVIGASGTGMTFSIPVCQYTKIGEGDRNGKVISNLDWMAQQNGSTVDDEFSIQF
jgi:hypothetical protein